MKYYLCLCLFSLAILAMEEDDVKDLSHLPEYNHDHFLNEDIVKYYLKQEKSPDDNTFVHEAINRHIKGFLSHQDSRFIKYMLLQSEFSQSEAQMYADMREEWWNNVKDLSSLEKITLYFLQDEYLRNNYLKYLDDNHYINMLAQALDAEKAHKDKIVFYHGVDPLGSFMYDVLTHVRAMIYGDKNLTEKINIFRGNDKPFALFHNVHEFIDAFTPVVGKINNYKKLETKEGVFAYPDMGLSANMFLLGSKGRANSETFSYFYDLYSATQVPYEAIFNNTMKEMGLSLKFSDFLPIYEQYMTSEKDGTKIYNGKLSQIFIDPQVVDAMAYLATAGGGVTLVDGSYGVLNVVRDLRANQESLVNMQRKLSSALFDGISVAQSVARLLPDFVKNESIRNHIDYGINQIQIRLFLKPEIEHDPRFFKVKTYWRRDISKEREKLYHKAIKNIIYPHLATWIKTHQEDRITALAIDPRPNMLKALKTIITSKKDHEYDLNCQLDQSYQAFIEDHMRYMGNKTINFAEYLLINFNDFVDDYDGKEIISLLNLKDKVAQGLAPYADYATYNDHAPIYISFNESCAPPKQGWKLHISAMPHSAEKIARLILPYLGKEVSYKLYGSLPLMRTMWYYDETSMSKTQIGKFITIYPQDIGQAKYLAETIDAILLKAINSGELDPINDFMPLSGDAQLGESGGLWTRYGVMAGHNDNMSVVNFDFTPKVNHNFPYQNHGIKKSLWMINEIKKANPIIIDSREYPWPNFMNEWPSDIPHPFGDMPLRFAIKDSTGNIIKELDWRTRPTLEWEVYISSLKNNI